MRLVNDESFLKKQFNYNIYDLTVRNVLLISIIAICALLYYMYSDFYIRENIYAFYTRFIPLVFAIVLITLQIITKEKYKRLKFNLYNLMYGSAAVMMYIICLIHLHGEGLAPSVTGTILIIFLTSLELKFDLRHAILLFFLPLVCFTIVLFGFFNPTEKEIAIMADIYPIIAAGFAVNRIQYNLRYKAYKTAYLLENEKQRTEELYEETVAMNEDLNVKAREAILHKEQIQEANEALQESNATKDKFFTIIAHDLKSPFNSILGFAKLLQTKYDTFDEAKKKRYVSNMYESSNRAYKLLENLLIWAQTQNNTIDFNPENLDVFKVLSNAIDPLMQVIKNKSINILNLVPAGVSVLADKNMLEMVFRNLISNAIKFTPKGGYIEIKANATHNTEQNNLVQISIKDSGVGMAADKLKKLFEVSKNNSTKGTDNEEGTGLGLLLCKDFIAKNNGEIKVASTLGKGSTFIITLPVQ